MELLGIEAFKVLFDFKIILCRLIQVVLPSISIFDYIQIYLSIIRIVVSIV